MSKEYEALKLELYSYKRKSEKRKNLLIDIEWIFIDGKEICLFCSANRKQGHSPNCELDAECNG